jgi:hypothetical protein
VDSCAESSWRWQSNRPDERLFLDSLTGTELICGFLLESQLNHGSPTMRESIRMTSIVPFGADQTIYLVVDGFGPQDTSGPNNENERTDLETVVADLLSGRFHDPIRVVAFNTLEHWSSDISADIALEIQSRCDGDGLDVPQYLAGFMERHVEPARHLT